MQNDFVKNLTVKDIANFFHLRQNDAAKHLGVSASTVKKICRSAGFERWPFRKVFSSSLCIFEFHVHLGTIKCACLVTEIYNLQVDAIARRTREIISSTNPTDPRKKAEVEAELQRLQRKKAELYIRS